MSDLYSLAKSDYVKGAIMFVGSGVITAILKMLEAGSFDINWHTVLNVAVVSFLSYLLKNFFTQITVDGSEFIAGKKIK